MAARAKKRKNAGAGYGYMFHGAFKDKKDAVAKEKKTKGAWIKGTLTNRGHRYLVMSPRTNPIKRKRKEKNPQHYEVTREFIGGTLKGLTHTEITPVKFRVGQVVRKPVAGSPYKIISVKPIGSRENPHELLVMGANPSEIDDHNTQEISLPPGATIVIRTPRQNPTNVNPDRFSSLRARAAGASYQAPGLIRTGKQKRVAGLVRVTRARAGKHKYDWIPEGGIAPGQNPGIGALLDVASIGTSLPGLLKKRRKNVELGTFEKGVFHPWTRRPKSRQKKAIRRQNPDAAGIREDFTGMPVEWEETTTEPHMPAGDYAKLGELLVLYVKPRAGSQVQQIDFKEPRPILVSDESARQLYFLGGDQDLSGSLSVFRALDRGDGLFELGEARRIDYKQRKEHVKEPEYDEWRHQLGEETEERPTVLFDSRHKRILFEGGAYEVRREGIVN
jgi:hypothetical protein